MKVAIKLSPDAVIAVHKTLQNMYDMPVSVNKIEKIYRSIGFDLADAFEKKFKAIIKNQTLFDKKNSKISLKFHEACALQDIISNLIHTAPNSFIASHLQNVINQLDQKTC